MAPDTAHILLDSARQAQTRNPGADSMPLSIAITVTDKLVTELGRTREAIDIAIEAAEKTEPDGYIHRGLIGRKAQVQRAWDAFIND